MASVAKWFDRILAWCPLYKAAVGGYQYYSHCREHQFRPEQFASFGRNVRISGNVTIRAPHRMHIGDGVWIAQGCAIHAVGGVYLGSYCAVAARTTILTVDHVFRGAESLPFGNTRMIKPVYIEDYVWIGMSASILPGVRIGEGAVIGFGAVVPKDVPRCAIMVGNPARIVGYRDIDAFERLKAASPVRAASDPCTRLWVPPEMREKYADQLELFGYDVADGTEFFQFGGGDDVP